MHVHTSYLLVQVECVPEEEGEDFDECIEDISECKRDRKSEDDDSYICKPRKDIRRVSSHLNKSTFYTHITIITHSSKVPKLILPAVVTIYTLCIVTSKGNKAFLNLKNQKVHVHLHYHNYIEIINEKIF